VTKLNRKWENRNNECIDASERVALLDILVMSFCYIGAPTRGVCSIIVRGSIEPITFDAEHKFMRNNLLESQLIVDMNL